MDPCCIYPEVAKGLLAQRGLRVASNRMLGRGYFTRAYLLEDGDVAVITTDPVKMEFMQYAQENEDSPHFPRVKAIYTNGAAAAKSRGWSYRDGKWQRTLFVPSWTIITERLKHDSVLVRRPLRRNISGISVTRIYSLSDLVATHANAERQGNYSFANALCRLMNWVDTFRMTLDMHSRNLMVRESDGAIVINDPVVNKRGPQ